MATGKTIDSLEDFADSPVGVAERWDAEMMAANRETEKWEKASTKIVDRFLDLRRDRKGDSISKLNLFTANIQTLRSMLYGQLPMIDCKRRDNDQEDDVARVAARIMERMLNNDVQRDGDSYADTIRYALDDRLTVGLGLGRIRYEAEFEEVETPPLMQPGPDGTEIELAPGFKEEKKTWEDAVVDYVHWKDVKWSPARVWGEVRWLAFRSHLTKDQMSERFGEKIAKAVPYDAPKKTRVVASDSLAFDTWSRCQVWEIWDKDGNKVHWWVKGYEKILDTKDDPLQLEDFWPCPKFMLANLTTSAFMPRADFSIHQDLYNEIDNLSTRINWLQMAVKAVGVYDKSASGVQRMLEEGFENDLIPVDNWAMFAEKGGIQGTIQWMPLADIVGAMDKLREYRKELIELLNQVSGMSDILRGASTQPNVTATEQGLKARYSSVRVTALQDMFADFASGLQQLKAEVIVKHFDDATIIERSNIMATVDKPFVPQALELLRSKFAQYKIEILPDNIARADYAATKTERTEYLTAVGTFISQVLPMAEQMPDSVPMLVQMIQWVAAGFRGGQKMETVLDQAFQKLLQAEKQGGDKPKEPNPEEIKAQAEQAKQQGRIQEAMLKAKARLEEVQAKQAADQQVMAQEHANDIAKIEAELQADLEREASQAEWNALEEKAKQDAGLDQRIELGRRGLQ